VHIRMFVCLCQSVSSHTRVSVVAIWENGSVLLFVPARTKRLALRRKDFFFEVFGAATPRFPDLDVVGTAESYVARWLRV